MTPLVRKGSQMPLRKGEDASYSAALHALLESLVMCPSAPPRELMEHVICRVETIAFLCFRGAMHSQIWCCTAHWTWSGASRKHIQYSALHLSVLDFITFYPTFKQFPKFKKVQRYWYALFGANKILHQNAYTPYWLY